MAFFIIRYTGTIEDKPYESDKLSRVRRLQGFESELVKEYIRESSPQFVNYISMMLRFLDRFDITNLQKENENTSLYGTLINFLKFNDVSSLNMEDSKAVNLYVTNYLKSMDFRNNIITYKESEYFKRFMDSASQLYGARGTAKSYDWFVRLVGQFTLVNNDVTIKFHSFFTNQNGSLDLPPAYNNSGVRLEVADASVFSVGDVLLCTNGFTGVVSEIYDNKFIYFLDSDVTGDTPIGELAFVSGTPSVNTRVIDYDEDIVIFSDLPVYYKTASEILLHTNLEHGASSILRSDFGNYPFEFQILSKSYNYYTSGLHYLMLNLFKPTGYVCWTYFEFEPVLTSFIVKDIVFKHVFYKTFNINRVNIDSIPITRMVESGTWNGSDLEAVSGMKSESTSKSDIVRKLLESGNI